MHVSCTVVGYVGKDSESRFTPSGKRVTSFSVATSRKWKDASGEQREATVWWRITTWEKLAEICAEYVRKGMLVLVDGDQVEAHAYADKSGEPAASLELRANTVRFLSKRGDGEQAPEPENDVPF
jgi:single-strand DNA-binding protein